jgi:hypothetical protein
MLQAAAVNHAIVAVFELTERAFAVFRVGIFALKAAVDRLFFQRVCLGPLLMVVPIFAQLLGQVRADHPLLAVVLDGHSLEGVLAEGNHGGVQVLFLVGAALQIEEFVIQIFIHKLVLEDA